MLGLSRPRDPRREPYLRVGGRQPVERENKRSDERLSVSVRLCEREIEKPRIPDEPLAVEGTEGEEGTNEEIGTTLLWRINCTVRDTSCFVDRANIIRLVSGLPSRGA
jgi:hypothetical protein